MTVNLLLFIVISFTNVFLHIFRTLLVVKSGKLIASLMNCICYTFSAVVVKFISESDLLVAMIVAASTNFLGCYVAMLVFEKIKKA
jgi:glucose-6-phosphate-specific signal transduction histidine kinase